MSDEDPQRGPRPTRSRAALERLDEPPVVARLVIEIRSDGTRTIARGAMEDVASGTKVAVEAHGSTPLQLAFGLARSMFAAPAMARTAVRAVAREAVAEEVAPHTLSRTKDQLS